MNKWLLLVFLLISSLGLVYADSYPVGTWLGYNSETGKFIPVALNASGSALVEGIGSVPESYYKSAIDTANQETSADFDAAAALVTSNYSDIKTAIENACADMTGIKPSGYAAKITEGAYTLAFGFHDPTACIEYYAIDFGGPEVVIPATIRGVTVAKLGQSRAAQGFQVFNTATIKYVVLPDQPITFYIRQFLNSTLKSAKIPSGSILESSVFGANIAFQKLGSNITSDSEGSFSNYSGLKTLYEAGGKAAGNFVYTSGSWKRVENCTDSFSMENAPLTRADYLEIFNLLQTVTAKNITLTGGYKLSELTAADKLIATSKGWTLIE